MTTETFSNAVSGINKSFIAEAIDFADSKKAIILRRKAVCAVASVLLIFATAFSIIPLLSNDSVRSDYTRDVGASSGIENFGYVPSFRSPTLEEAYTIEPFSGILPRIIPDGYIFTSSYLTEKDDFLKNNGNEYLSFTFTSEDGTATFQISASLYNGATDFADPNDTSTFSLKLFYQNREAGKDGNQNTLLPFRAEDFSKSVIYECIYLFPDEELCKASVRILCGDYIVSYNYNGKKGIDPDILYDTVVSSYFFENE